MTQITFKNRIDEKKLDILLYLLKSWDIDAEVSESVDMRADAGKQLHKKMRSANKKIDLFAETRGMWADYDITDKQLREMAWGAHSHLS